MTARAKIITALAVLTASPALSSTVHNDIILTDFGFRQAADCQQVWPRHVWTDGHYHSVRPAWECTDEPYLSGKGSGLMVADDAAPLILAMAIPIAAPLVSVTPQAAPYSPASAPPLIWASTPPRRDTLPPVTPPAPVPLPATGLLMMLGLGALAWRVRV